MYEHRIPELALGLQSGGDGDGVVEGETEGLVGLVVTLGTAKHILVQVIANGEQGAAGSVRRGILAVGTCYAPRDSAYNRGD